MVFTRKQRAAAMRNLAKARRALKSKSRRRRTKRRTKRRR